MDRQVALVDTKKDELEKKFLQLKEKCQPIFAEDPTLFHTDASLWRFLCAHGTVDGALCALLKCSKWRQDFGVDSLTDEDEDIRQELTTGKAVILDHRDRVGRPVILIATRKHNAYDRDIDRLTKFIVYNLEQGCRLCDEEIIDNLCIIYDLKDFSMGNMDYQFIKNLIWLLSRFYPERLGVCLIINAPMIFYGCWTIIRPWMNDVTASKVTFISNEKQLSEYILPSVIPKD